MKETNNDQSIKNEQNIPKQEIKIPKQKQNKTAEAEKIKNLNSELSGNIIVLVSKRDDQKIVNQFLNIIELYISKKNYINMASL